MSERDVTMSTCPHCDQPVQPSLHTTVQCLDNMRNQRDEARTWARDAWQMVSYAERKQMFDPPPDWLKETSKR